MNIIDRDSVSFVAGIFRSKGYNVEITPDDKDPFDILLHTPKGDIAVEVKERNCSHDKYPDMRMGVNKWQEAREGLKAGTLIAAIACCLYLDGWMGMGHLKNGHLTHATGPLTTHFAYTVRVQKDYWDVPYEALIPPHKLHGQTSLPVNTITNPASQSL